ncbi:MAG: 4-alpha-glucanotransferase [Myxococcota bacterium]|nr:4-alpha-glucanotransferase [Myxococcota bacterium]
MSTLSAYTQGVTWPPQRSAGVLVHLTSIPGSEGLGDLGAGAIRFLDWLAEAKLKLWQLLPLNPIGAGASPYSSPSAFAANPLLISLNELAAEGLLDQEALVTEICEGETGVTFSHEVPRRMKLLAEATARFVSLGHHHHEAFQAFLNREKDWLPDAALFASLSSRHQSDWSEWPVELRDRSPDAMRAATEELAEEILHYQVQQYFFDQQWSKLRAAAIARGITLIGDLPIYVSYESADVWANPSLFELDEAKRPSAVAGVPPDAFSETGQRWGNPLYNWEALAAQDYQWWAARIRRALSLTPALRVDHFRAFASYWSIPRDAPDARRGVWRKGPGLAFFKSLEAQLGSLPLIAEDLGLIDDEVRNLRRDSGLPGMKVVQFAFSGEPDHEYLPHRHEPLSIAYPGTHDNDTTIGWWSTLGSWEREWAMRYLELSPEMDAAQSAWRIIERTLEAGSSWAIVALQDYLSLDSRARMNTPGKAEGNWSWRARDESLSSDLAARVAALVTRSHRGES